MKIEAEDFKAWLDNPVTEVVIKYLKKRSDECKEHWLAKTWATGECDPLLLIELRAKEQILSDLANLKHEDIDGEE